MTKLLALLLQPMHGLSDIVEEQQRTIDHLVATIEQQQRTLEQLVDDVTNQEHHSDDRTHN